jgi:hypothetical protein
MAEEIRKFKSTAGTVVCIRRIPGHPKATIDPENISAELTSGNGTQKAPSKKIVLRLIEFFKQ